MSGYRTPSSSDEDECDESARSMTASRPRSNRRALRRTSSARQERSESQHSKR
jgi:hypothetical protein